MVFSDKLYIMIGKVSVAILYFVKNNGEGVQFGSLSPQIYFSHIATDANPNLMAVLEPAFLKQTKK